MKNFRGMFKSPSKNKELEFFIQQGGKFAGFTSYFNSIGVQIYIPGHYGMGCYVPSKIIDLHEGR